MQVAVAVFLETAIAEAFCTAVLVFMSFSGLLESEEFESADAVAVVVVLVAVVVAVDVAVVDAPILDDAVAVASAVPVSDDVDVAVAVAVARNGPDPRDPVTYAFADGSNSTPEPADVSMT